MKKSIVPIMVGVLILSIVVNLLLIVCVSELAYKQVDEVSYVNRAFLESQTQIKHYLEGNANEGFEDKLFHYILDYTGHMPYSNAILFSALRYISPSKSNVEYTYSEYKSNPTIENEEYWRASLEEFLQEIEHVSEIFEIHLETYSKGGYLNNIKFFILNRNLDYFTEWFPPYEYIP